METKKSIVRSAIFKKANSGTNGLYYIFEIKFDNGDLGVYFSSKEQQDTFKEGQEIEYTIEEKVNGQYKNYSIKPVKAAFQKMGGNPMIEHKRTALRCAVELAGAGKIEVKQISTFADSFMKFLNA